MFDKISESHMQNFSRLFNNENWISRQVQGHPSQSQPNYVKPACNYITADAGEEYFVLHGCRCKYFLC